MVEQADNFEADNLQEETKAELITCAPGEAEVKLTSIDLKLKGTLEDRQKYALIFDTTGECEVFFRYKAHMMELSKLSLSISLGRTSREEVIE